MLNSFQMQFSCKSIQCYLNIGFGKKTSQPWVDGTECYLDGSECDGIECKNVCERGECVAKLVPTEREPNLEYTSPSSPTSGGTFIFAEKKLLVIAIFLTKLKFFLKK